MIRKTILLDIDNCISDDGWRIPLIDWSNPDPFMRYHEYQIRSPQDLPGNTDLFLGHKGRIFLLTSRPLSYRPVTLLWLHAVGVPFEAILMRNNNDHRSSVDVKRSQLLSLPEYGVEMKDIVCAYDDRPEICAMYREHGLHAKVRSIHSVCAYVNPHTGVNHANGEKAA